MFYGPVPDGEFDASEADARLVGAPGDHAGFSMAAGDFDGDGADDVAVGAVKNSSAATKAGAVYLVSGTQSISGTVVLPEQAAATYTGAGTDDFAGWSVAAVPGTTTSPGQNPTDALLVGAPYNDSTATNAGAAYLVRDALTGDTETAPVSLLDAADMTFLGGGQGDLAGYAVASGEDTDDDDDVEVLVGAPRNDSTATTAGAVYVLDARGDAETVVSAGTRLVGTAAYDRAGQAVAGAGDTNGDGYDDVIVGAPYSDSGGNNSGTAYLVYGPADENMILAGANVTLVGVGELDRAGWAVSAAGSGDVNCDDRDDVLIGLLQRHQWPECRTAYLVYGGLPDGTYGLETANATFLGESGGDRAGWSVDGVNDTSGDGLEDVFVGAPGYGPNESGAGYLVNGKCPAGAEKTPTATPTDKPHHEATDTPTDTPADTPTDTPADTPTDTLTATSTDTPTATDTPTDTPDRRAAISFVILCTQDAEAEADVGGEGADECPKDGKAFVRWVWNDDTNQFESEGSADGTTMTATEFKENGEPVQARWTSETYNGTGAVVGSGGDTCTYEYDKASSGTVESCDSSAGQGQGQAAITGPSAGMSQYFIPAISSASLLAGAVLVFREQFW